LTSNARAHVWDLEVVGDTIYVAGKFRRVVESRGAWPRHDQPFLAAFDTTTGHWRPEFRPALDRPAYALAVLPSGSLLVGGEFTRANGRAARGLVAVDPTTGATDPTFRGQVGRPGESLPAVVRDLEVRGDRAYVVGHFSRASGPGTHLTVHQAARFATVDGRPDRAWRPRLLGRSAWAVSVSADGRRVHLGGEFSSFGSRRGTSQLVTVRAADGRLVPGWDHGSNAPWWPGWPVGGIIYDLGVYRNRLYVAGAEHFWEVRNSLTGGQISYRRITNDAQSVDVVGGRVYIGCHCFHRAPERQVWEVAAATAAVYPGRTGALVSGDGTWASAVDAQRCLWLGGDFNVATDVVGLGAGEWWVGRLARLCPPGVGEAVRESAPGPVNPPGWQPDPA